MPVMLDSNNHNFLLALVQMRNVLGMFVSSTQVHGHNLAISATEISNTLNSRVQEMCKADEQVRYHVNTFTILVILKPIY